MKAYFKFLYIVLCIVTFIVLFSFFNFFIRKMIVTDMLNSIKIRLINQIIKTLGIEIAISRRRLGGRPSLYIGNHMSYLDVLILKTVLPATFVTSNEIGNTPFLGSICKRAGCLFVDRKSIWSLKKEVNSVASKLKNGDDVVIFPEGTTTDGLRLLPFRSSLLEAARLAKVYVTPFSIRYRFVGEEKFAEKNHHLVCWYGEMGFTSHLLNLCRTERVRVELKFFDSIKIDDSVTRKEVALYSESCLANTENLAVTNCALDFDRFYGDRMIHPGQLSTHASI